MIAAADFLEPARALGFDFYSGVWVFRISESFHPTEVAIKLKNNVVN